MTLNSIFSFSGYQIHNRPFRLLQVVQILGDIRGRMGNSGQIVDSASAEDEYDGYGRKARFRSTGMLCQGTEMLPAGFLVQVPAGNEKQDEK